MWKLLDQMNGKIILLWLGLSSFFIWGMLRQAEPRAAFDVEKYSSAVQRGICCKSSSVFILL
jgi:hypothetical protein